ncbi:MAG: hypothetical protein ACKPKO_40140, partial [Candidatus Fonsibacter sp.]
IYYFHSFHQTHKLQHVTLWFIICVVLQFILFNFFSLSGFATCLHFFRTVFMSIMIICIHIHNFIVFILDTVSLFSIIAFMYIISPLSSV